MTIEQIEQTVIELIHREPFVPFCFEMADGEFVHVTQPGLAINGGGAGFIGSDGGLVDVPFKDVRGIRPLNFEAIA